MARKKHGGEHVNHERWLISYADFITLLFAFFVVMFASSQTDKAKAQQVSDSVTKALEKSAVQAVVHEILGGTVDDKGKGNAMMKGPGGSKPVVTKDAPPPAVAELVPSMEVLTQELSKEIKDGKIDVHLESRGLVVSLRDATFFPPGQDTVAPDTFGSIEKIAATIRKLPNSVRLEGHTDSIPIHTARFRSNWELSAARSIAMLELFSNQYKIPRDRMAIAGYADTAPKESNDTEEGRAHNRRVDIVILNKQVVMKDPVSPEPVPFKPGATPATTQPAATPVAQPAKPPVKK